MDQFAEAAQSLDMPELLKAWAQKDPGDFLRTLRAYLPKKIEITIAADDAFREAVDDVVKTLAGGLPMIDVVAEAESDNGE